MVYEHAIVFIDGCLTVSTSTSQSIPSDLSPYLTVAGHTYTYIDWNQNVMGVRNVIRGPGCFNAK
jgi:hypothetical protein